MLYSQETENFAESVRDTKNNINKLHVDHLLIVKPYVIINGPSLDNIISAYVVIDDHMYQIPSPLLAVDICFQCVKLFGDSFSQISSHVWQYLERSVYGFDVPNPCGAVSTLEQKLFQYA